MTTCRRCNTAAGTVTPYWALDGHMLCGPCCVAVAERWDAEDRWPPVPWTTEDEELIS